MKPAGRTVPGGGGTRQPEPSADRDCISNVLRSGRNFRSSQVLRIMPVPSAWSGVRLSNWVPWAHRGLTGREPVEPRPQEPCAGCGHGAKSCCQFSSPSFSSNCLSASQSIVIPKSPDTRASREQILWIRVSHPEPRGWCLTAPPLPSFLSIVPPWRAEIFIFKVTVWCRRENIFKGSFCFWWNSVKLGSN